MGVRDTIAHAQISSRTVCKWNEIIIKLSILYYLENCMTQIGSHGRIVEMDETHIFSRKYHRGRMLVSESVLVVGAICRTDKKDCLRIVRNSNAEVFNTGFLHNIMPGSTVITVMWRGYNGVSEFG
jgi:hypothetical protein